MNHDLEVCRRLGGLFGMLMTLLLNTQVIGDDAQLKPDVVIFLSDDHTVTDCSVYGSSEVPTPNMDRLAKSGMTFDRAYVASPSCAPSRAALLTGMSPSRNGAEANHSRPRGEVKKWPAYFRELGYEVVAFGKVGHYRQTPDYGFDIARHVGYHEDIAIDKAVEWLQQRESERPLCLFVGTNWPHVPWPDESTIPPDDVRVPSHHVDTPETRQARRNYLQAVRTMDEELGKVHQATLEVLGQDTLFVHTSDHGAQWPFGKWNLYEEGIRTPMIVSWPGKVAPGTRTDAMVSWIDLLPTLVEAVGGDADATATEPLDGKSFLPVLTGERQSHRDAIFTTHSGDGNFNVYPSRAVTEKRYKYIRNLRPEFEFHSHVTKASKNNLYWSSWLKRSQDGQDGGIVRRYHQRTAEQLFDLESDSLELENLAGSPEHASVLSKLSTRLDVWMRETGDSQTVHGMPDLIARNEQPRPGPRPNVIMVFIDDMGWADLSCFGGTDVETKNIDALATEGIRLTNFYVNAPICSPSRTALLTGHYPARHDITSYLARRELNERRGIANWLDLNAPTLPRMLTRSGYACGHFGKWHMGGQRDVGEAPLVTEYGFEASLTNFEGLGHRVLPLCDAYDGKPPRKHDLGSASLGRGPIEWEDRSLITSRFVTGAIQFMDQHLDGEDQKPFYINLWPDDVHSPFFPPESRRGDGGKRHLYHRVLETMDEQLGVLFDRVRNDPRLRSNTLILLASDNGHEPGAGSGGPLRGKKGDLYEGGIRSPLIVWGPGLIRPSAMGQVNRSTIASSVDLVASLIELCGAKSPDGYQGDGEEILGALLGHTLTAQRTSPLFWRRPPDRPGTIEAPLPDLAVRDKQWKLFCNVDGSHVELYDLEKDLAESRNIAKRHPAVVKRLRSSVLSWNETLPDDVVTTSDSSNRFDWKPPFRKSAQQSAKALRDDASNQKGAAVKADSR
ncbi:MAG: sulfatase-like hydrolase/transferase [Planctomycetota bacterium]